MTLTRGLLVYIRIPLLIVLVGAFYWRDFFAIWQTTISTGWIIFTSVIVFLVSVFVFQRRKPLKTLLSMCENSDSQGAVFVLLALVLYVVGSYTPYALWLHVCSLILFVVGYLVLVVDFRLLRTLFLPLVSLLFVIPPIGNEVLEVQNLQALFALYLSVDAVIGILVVYIIKERMLQNEMKSMPCPLCQSDMFREEVFCFHCGRQRLSPQLKPFKFAFMKFFVLLSIVLVLSFVYVPTFSLVGQEASLRAYTPHGMQEQIIIPTPDGWKLKSSERLVNYEGEHNEDLAMLNLYVSVRNGENEMGILLEVSSQYPYMMNDWMLLGWSREVLKERISLSEDVLGRCMFLQKSDATIVVLQWSMRTLFNTESFFRTKYAGVSVFGNFTKHISESEVQDFSNDLVRVGAHLANHFNMIKLWAVHAQTLREISLRFGNVFWIVLSTAGLFAIAGWVRAKDAKIDKLTENALHLLEHEATLLIAVSTIKKRKFTGKELFDAYQQLAESEVNLDEFYNKLKALALSNLIEKDYALREGKLLCLWKRMFP